VVLEDEPPPPPLESPLPAGALAVWQEPLASWSPWVPDDGETDDDRSTVHAFD
jgi:hypothetical protein